MSKFIRATDEPSGKRAHCVAGMLAILADADEPVPWAQLCDDVGMDHHGQLRPAFDALELVGAVDRFTFVDDNGTKPKAAYALSESVEVKS
jgi:hypothetical protein